MTSKSSKNTAYSQLSTALEIASKCIGFELSKEQPTDSKEFLDEYNAALDKLSRKPNKNEYIAQGFDILTGKPVVSIDEIPLRIDYMKKWKTYLSDKDYENLAKQGFTKDILENWEGPIGIADRNYNILIIRTKSSTWRELAGREWHYDRSTGLLKIHSMN